MSIKKTKLRTIITPLISSSPNDDTGTNERDFPQLGDRFDQESAPARDFPQLGDRFNPESAPARDFPQLGSRFNPEL